MNGARKRILAAVALSAVAGIVLWRAPGTDGGESVPVRASVAPSEDAAVPAASGSPFAPVDRAADTVVVDDAGDEAKVAAPTAVESPSPTLGAGPTGSRPLDVAALGIEPMSDDEFERVKARLLADPALRVVLIDELRTTHDAARIERLSILLGELEDPSVEDFAAELVYSGDAALEAAGLDLLKRSGGDGAQTTSIVSGLLSTETGTEVLLPTLNAIARPGAVDDEERAAMAAQVALLATHEDPLVRSSSLDILARWTRDGSDAPVLVAGLSDEDASVRRSAAYALVGHEAPDESMVFELLRVVEDGGETMRVRQGALLALKRMPTLDAGLRERLPGIEKALNRRQR